MRLKDIQEAITASSADGWLFYDIHKRDEIAYRILGVDDKKLTTRRWFYFVPATGNPAKLVHKIEASRLDEIPGEKVVYVSWGDMHNKLEGILHERRRVFMQFSPQCNIPSVSLVDAGTVDLIRSLGKEVLSSANLVQLFEATIDDEGVRLHESAAAKIQRIKDQAFELAADSIKSSKRVTEHDVQQFILQEFEDKSLTCDGLHPIVAVNAHAADPHFEVSQQGSSPIESGDRLLIDLWAREDVPKGIYYDITWCAFMGAEPEPDYEKLFGVVVQARKRTKDFIAERINNGTPVCGWEADEVCRNFIREQGYAEYFIHRTGHSIHRAVHGNGVNLDNLETKDERQIIPGTCFSIEPGIYKDDIGVRSEINMLIDSSRRIVVAGAEQEQLLRLK